MSEDFLQIVLFQLFMLILFAEVAKIICNKIRIPSVIGEILVGVIIFNSFLYGYLSIETDRQVFEVLKELGVIFLLFSVGLETPFSSIRKVGSTAIGVAVIGVIVPFVAGYGLMTLLGFTQLEALFVAAAMVATSVGITARVIKDMNLMHALESRVIIGAAVIDDILGMIVLAIVVGISTGAGLNVLDVAVVSVEAVLFVLAVIFIGSLVMPRVVTKHKERKAKKVCTADRRPQAISPLPLVLIICFALSFMSSILGLAAIIGAFLAGMAFAEFKDSWPVEHKIEPITEFLTPFFFIFVGIGVDLSEFADVLWLAVAITILAIATKFAGCGFGARKLGGKSAAIIGIGMSPRGEVGLIVASIGLAFIGPGLYNSIVFMALVTTLVAPPLLTYAFRRKLGKKCELVPPDTS